MEYKQDKMESEAATFISKQGILNFLLGGTPFTRCIVIREARMLTHFGFPSCLLQPLKFVSLE
jgi:hypothetical protein